MKTITIRHITSAILVALLLTSCSNPEGDFKKAEQANTEQAFNAFIQKHPDSPLVVQARAHIETLAFKSAQTANNPAAWEAFLQKYPQSTNAQFAHIAIEKLDYEGAIKTDVIASYEAFLSKYPKSERISEIERRLEPKLEERDWKLTQQINDTIAYREFLTKHPQSSHIRSFVVTFEGRIINDAFLVAAIEEGHAQMNLLTIPEAQGLGIGQLSEDDKHVRYEAPNRKTKWKVLCVKDGTGYRIIAAEVSK